MDMNGILDVLAPAMSRDNTADDDQFTEDGLRICAKCGERKQTWFEVKGVIARNKVPCICRCERERLEAEEAARKQEEQYRLIKQYRIRGLTDEKYRGYTFAMDDGMDEKASAFCKAYVDNWAWVQENSAGIMLWGDVGVGKTFLAACVANALIDKGIPATMTTIPRLVAAMTKDFGKDREDVLYMVANAPLLVLDDVGTEQSNSEYSYEKVYEIVNTRCIAKKPLVITTNLAMKEMAGETDQNKKRIYDRLIEMCTPCKVTSTGRRQKAAKDRMEQMMAQFGL